MGPCPRRLCLPLRLWLWRYPAYTYGYGYGGSPASGGYPAYAYGDYSAYAAYPYYGDYWGWGFPFYGGGLYEGGFHGGGFRGGGFHGGGTSAADYRGLSRNASTVTRVPRTVVSLIYPLARDRRVVTVIEYGLIASMVAVVIVFAVTSLDIDIIGATFTKNGEQALAVSPRAASAMTGSCTPPGLSLPFETIFT